MIFLAGTHNTGKTTLAKLFAERARVPYIGTTASATFKRLGADPTKDYDFATTLYIQNHVLDDLSQQWGCGKEFFITDRAPVDMYAYTLTRVQRENMTPDLEKALEMYKAKCLSLNESLVDLVMVLQPGIPLEAREGRGPLVRSYMEHHSHLVMSLSQQEFLTNSLVIVDRRITDLEDRYTLLMKLVAKNASRPYQNAPVAQQQVS